MSGHYIPKAQDRYLVRQVEENDGGGFPVQGNCGGHRGGDSSGGERQSDDLIEQLRLSRAGGGARKLQHRKREFPDAIILLLLM